ncbi:MAG TPA: hypothetical protein VMH91_00950 [Candidatus Paceibacterota bacterium]|nr:hypothetical protein [Candidatus Paceibacterota bacterium]
MKKYMTLLRLVITGIAVLALGALLGWYYFLHGAQQQVTTDSAARSFGSGAPSFEGTAGSTYQNAASTLGESVGGVSTSTPAARLWEVSQVPVAGLGWQNGSVPTLRFVERSSGNVLEATPSDHGIMRLTDTLRPEIYAALITLDGSVLERSVDDSGTLITFAGNVATTTETSATSSPDMLQGVELPQGIRTIAADPLSDTLYYAIAQPSGISLVSTNWAGQKEKQLYSSPLTQWRLITDGDGGVVLLQAPADGVEGYAYRLQKNGSLSLVAQAPGLTLLPDASTTALLFGTSQGGTLSLFTQSSASASPQRLSIQTVADKCAWGPGKSLTAYCGVPTQTGSQQFLDDWYKGIVHTSDTFYEVDAQAASTTLLYDPTGDTQNGLDVEDPMVDPSGQYIAFTNAADQSLWILRIAP